MSELACIRCRQPDDGKLSCLVECVTCCGAGCARCKGTGKYRTYHMVLADDPTLGTVELEPIENKD